MPIFLIFVFAFIFGLIIGSFLNCLIWRLYKNESLMGRSCCPKCGQQINWYDNIPLLSFIFLKGKCRRCHQAISWQYPIVELVTGALFLTAFYFNFSSLSQAPTQILSLLSDWFFISVMIVIFIYDLRWYQILDKVTLPACLAVFLMNLALGFSLFNLLISGI